MSRLLSNLNGVVFGRLKVVGLADRELWRNKHSHWICVCECGKEKIINSQDLKSGNVNSCGCILKEKNRNRMITHGNSSHPLYSRWQQMQARCNNPNMPHYKNYGGRGIKVCKRWDKFENFVEDMGDLPSPTHSLDRIDNDGNYSKSNCKWSTPREQQLNKRNSIKYRYYRDNENIQLCLYL